MAAKVFTTIFIFLIISFSNLNAEKKALFMGNSFTSGMPEIVQLIAGSAGDSLSVVFSWGGQTLGQHLDNPMTHDYIRSADWDYVVMQENSQISGFPPSDFEYYAYNPAKELNDSIKANNKCTQTVFYMTWGYLNGDLTNFPDDTYWKQQNRIRRNYLFLAEEFDGLCSPVGMAWRHVRENKPWINLYAPDEYHPIEPGMYLTALVFYTLMFEKSPVGLFIPSQIPDSTALFFQETAAMIVLDSLDTWRIGEDVPNNPPTVLSPENGTLLTALDIEFDWLPKSLIETYDLQVSESRDFDPLFVDESGLTVDAYTESFTEYGKKYYYRVRGRYTIDGPMECATAWSSVREFTTPYEGPILISPENGAACQPMNGRLEWQEHNSSEAYRLQVSAYEDFHELIIDEDYIRNTHYDYSLPEELAVYHWRVQDREFVINEKWSEVRLLSTGIKSPDPSLPADNEIAIPPWDIALVWIDSHTSASYNLQLATDIDFNEILVDESEISATSYTFTTEEYYTNYYWRVSVKFGGCESVWSKTYAFRTELPAPELISPEDSSVSKPLTLPLEWETKSPEVKDELLISDDPDFENIVFGKTGLTSSQFLVQNLEPRTWYYWKVRSFTEEESSGWSEIYRFETGDKTPDIPVLLSPENKEKMVPLDEGLLWEKTETADFYHIQLADDDEFENLIIDESDITDTLYSPINLENFKTYYWRVRAGKSNLFSSWSQSWSFRTIAPVLTESPILLLPDDNAEDILAPLLLDWEDMEYARNYFIEIATVDSFEPDKIILSDSTGFSSYETDELDPETLYFWRARGNNEAGAGPWSDSRSFTTGVFSGVDDLYHSDGISVYPNPSDGRFSIRLNNVQEEVRYSITDITGREIVTGRTMPVNSIFDFNLNNVILSDGLYLIRIITLNKIEHVIIAIKK